MLGFEAEVARQALDLLDVDDFGFDMLDRKLLLAIIEKFAGGPVGLVEVLGLEAGDLFITGPDGLFQFGRRDIAAGGRAETWDRCCADRRRRTHTE